MLGTFVTDFSKFWFTPVPVEYLNWGLGLLLLLASAYQHFGGYRLASFYFVSFLGLLPFRLMKTSIGIGDEVANMHMGSVIFAIAIFLFVWYNIDRVLPLLFNTRVGQTIIAYTLLIGDRVTSFTKLFINYPVIKGLLLAYFLIILVFIWSLLNFHSAFFLSLSYPWLFYKNLLRHFFTDEVSESLKKENLSAELNENPLNFDWEHFVSLMSSVALAKHKFSVKNHLKFKNGSFKYPNLAQRYMVTEPLVEAASKAAGTIKRTFSENSAAISSGTAVVVGISTVIQNWSSAVEEQKELNARSNDKIEADKTAQKAIRLVRAEQEKTLEKITEFSRKFRDLETNESKLMTPAAREATRRLSSSNTEHSSQTSKGLPLKTTKEESPANYSQEQSDTVKDYNRNLHKYVEQTLEEAGYRVTSELDTTYLVRSRSARFWTKIRDKFVTTREHRINADSVIEKAKNDPKTVEAVKKALNTNGQNNLPELSEENLKKAKLAAEVKIKSHYQNVIAEKNQAAIEVTKEYPRVPTTEEDRNSFFEFPDS